MQVKVFEAENMSQALRRVKQELGPSAIIISSRTVRKGKAGLLKKPRLEITAALEEESGSLQQQCGEQERNDSAACAASSLSEAYRQQQAMRSAGRESQEKGSVSQESALSGGGAFIADTEVSNSFQGIQSEIAELRRMVRELKGGGYAGGGFSGREGQDGAWAPGASASLEDRVLSALGSRGIEREAACSVAESLCRESDGEDIEHSGWQERICSVLAGHIRTRDTLWGKEEAGGRRLALLGPTGVGKTTTIAKLAANYMSQISPSVALVTIDNYRIAAVEQLKVYAEIMNIPLEVVTQPGQMPGVLQEHGDKDLILVDTAGQNPRDTEALEEMGQYLPSQWGVEKHLILSACTSQQDMQKTIQNFEMLQPDGLVFSKLDECVDYAPLFNVHFSCGYPLSYFTNGQKVPEDFMLADGNCLAQLIMQD